MAEVEIQNLGPEAVRGAVEQAGWTVYGGTSISKDARSSRWLWSVGRGERAGTVVLVRFTSAEDASAAALKIEKGGGASHVRGASLLAVVISRDSTSGQQLLSSVLRAVGGGAVASEPIVGAPVTVPTGAALPTIHFGRSPRSDVIAAVLTQGWGLTAAPVVVRNEGYDAVAYSLDHPRHGVLDVTVYDCHTAARAVEVGKLHRRADFAALRRGAVVIVIRGGKSVVTPVLKALERLP